MNLVAVWKPRLVIVMLVACAREAPRVARIRLVRLVSLMRPP